MADDQPYIQLPIETARLTLDPPSEKDDAAMRAMFSDLETMAHLRYMAKEWQNGWTEQEIVSRRENHCKAIAEKRGSTFYIHDKATHELVGVAGANSINLDDRNAVVGIILRKKYWSGGYGTEALYELMRGLFEDLKMHKVIYDTTQLNVGMRKFLEQTCGVPLAFIRNEEVWCKATNQWVDLWNYQIFEADWPRISAVLQESMRRGAAKAASNQA
ncbi:hypothetical protein BGX34_009358 [Mortierella sp. NVP85]|nr:hypothetical protein BGX34_009358 [Mortierella sp. NVP85]